MKVKVKQINFSGFKCVEITDGTISAVVTIDCGPRIISFGFKNGANHLAVLKNGAEKSDRFIHYGGHRLWHAPEHEKRTYCPDNSPISFKEVEGGAVFYGNEEAIGIVKMMSVQIPEEGILSVEHRIVNNSAFPVKLSAWAITNLAGGGTAVVPLPAHSGELRARGALAFWDYTSLRDERLVLLDNFVAVRHTDNPQPFKIGLKSDEEFAAYFNHGELFVKHFPYVEGEEYPSYGCNFECYTNDRFLELESLSPMETLPEYGGSIEYGEIWELFGGVQMPSLKDEELGKLLTDYLGSCEEGCGCGDGCDCGDHCGDGCDCGDHCGDHCDCGDGCDCDK